MTIRRLYSNRPLLVDINFLMSGFPAALADPLDHTLCTAELHSDEIAITT